MASLAKPRTAIIRVQAGEGRDPFVGQLTEFFEEGDIIVNDGTANFHDTIHRERDLRQKGLHSVGTGISSGVEGALKVPSIVPGESAESYKTVGTIFESIAAVVDVVPWVAHVGTGGAGHFEGAVRVEKWQ